MGNESAKGGRKPPHISCTSNVCLPAISAIVPPQCSSERLVVFDEPNTAMIAVFSAIKSRGVLA